MGTLMMLTNAFILLLLLLGQDCVRSIRLLELRVPAHEREGGSALLGCQYDLEGDQLYSVKWYKDDQEFFRYVPMGEPRMIAFKQPGVNVDLTKSSSTVVALQNLTLESEGLYTCEVSGEAPSFYTTRSQKSITIHLVPETGPLVTGIQEKYYLDEQTVINCTSFASRPKAHLEWFINNVTVSESETGKPRHRVSASRPDAIETTLQLKFTVAPKHFVDGAMELKCRATIAPLYQRETKSTHYLALPFTFTEKAMSFDNLEDNGYSDGAENSSSKNLPLWYFLLAVIAINEIN